MNMMLLGAYTLSVVLLLLTPGPVVALVTGTAVRHGYRQAWMTLLGTNGASLVLILMATLILAGVISLPPLWLYLLGGAGSLYIGYAAVGGLMAGVSRDTRSGAPVLAGGGFTQGFMTGVANPKDILFFVAFFPQFIAVTSHFGTSILTLSMVWIFFDLLVLSLYVLLVKRWMPARHSKHIALISSLFLLAVSLFGVLYNGVKVTLMLA